MKSRHALKRLLKLSPWLLAIAGIALLGWALYGRQSEAAAEKTVSAAFYKEDAGLRHTLENEYLVLELDGDTTQFTVTNKQDGHVWHSSPPDAARDPLALAGSKNLLQSTLALTYSTTNGVRTLYDNFEYSIKNQIYEIDPQEDSLRVNYTLGRIARAYNIPAVITQERMDGFLAQMTKAQSRKVLDSYRKHDPEKLRDNQREELLAAYPKLQDGVIYVIRDNVKDFLKEEFEGLFETAGYTYEDYLQDQATSELTVGEKSAVFNLSVIYRLEGPDLVVEVPLDSIRYTDDFPPIRLSLLPNFGAGGSGDEGYILVPEGGGGIIRFNNGKTTQNAYFTNVYGWDYATSRKAVVHETNVRFPVFGLSHTGSSFLCMMEGQAANASLSAESAGRGNSYNTVSASYNLLHSDAFNVTDRTIETIYMYENELPKGSISQRYRFLASDEVSDLAKAYRAYLTARYPGLQEQTQAGLPLSVEILGAIDKVQQKGGLPVSAPIRLTSFSEASVIAADMAGIPSVRTHVRLSGWMNGGLKQSLAKSVTPVRQLGSEAEFDQMTADIRASGAALYLHGITSFALDSGLKEGFLPLRDAARFTTREEVMLYHYAPVWYGELDFEESYYLLKPALAMETLGNLAKAASERGAAGISLEDMGSLLSADYNPRETVPRDEAAAMQAAALKGIAAEQRIMLRGGNLYALESASIITDTELEGSGYMILDETVPFIQMALHGLVPYTGRALNLVGDWEQELLLSVQRGAGLSFVFMKEEPLVLHDTMYHKYYGASYSLWAERAGDITRRYAREMGHLFNQAMVGFERLPGNLSRTDYADGTRVYVNFSQQPQAAEGQIIPPRDYLVLKGEVRP